MNDFLNFYPPNLVEASNKEDGADDQMVAGSLDNLLSVKDNPDKKKFHVGVMFVMLISNTDICMFSNGST